MTGQVAEAVLHDVPDDPVAVWEYFYERGWCDGLPIIPPTPERVSAMLEGVARDPKQVVARISPSDNSVTVEKIAVNAVMAGCVPGSVPVLIAAVTGICDPAFRLLSVGTTPATPLMILNGPIRHQLGVNCSYCCLGGITRVNATLGRALRLVCLNIGNGGARNILDQATHGLPTRISFCMGENEEASPWAPFHTQHGFRLEDSTVTVVNASVPLDIVDQEMRTSESMLKTYSGSICYQGSNNMETGRGKPFLVIGPEGASVFARDGMSREDIQNALWTAASLPVSQFPPELHEKWKKIGRPIFDGRVRLTRAAQDLKVLVAGGLGPHSLFLTTLGEYQINAVEA